MRGRPQGQGAILAAVLSSMSAKRGPTSGRSAPMAGLGFLSAGCPVTSRRTAQGQPWTS